MTFVLDNSVAMRWCFENAAHPYADGILNRLAVGEDALVPVLWFYEASAVLAREQNRGILAAPKADEFIAELKALRIAADAEDVMTNALHIRDLNHASSRDGWVRISVWLNTPIFEFAGLIWREYL